jgi:hypothetical protein
LEQVKELRHEHSSDDLPIFARLLVVALSSGVGVACFWNTAPHRSPRHAVQRAEIVGTWGITDHALRDYKSEGLGKYAVREAHRLEFRSDGTCALKTLLGGNVLGQPVDPIMPCTWRLVAQKDGPEISVQVEVRPGDLVGEGYTVGEQTGHLVLWNYITDPGARRYAEFEKGS